MLAASSRALANGAALAVALAAALTTATIAPASAENPRFRQLTSQHPGSRLAAVKTWTYQLQRLDDARLRNQSTDLVVIDYSHDGSEPRELWPIEVERFKRKADGGRRLALAYLSIGEAEDYRFYWPAAWDVRRPDWFLAETCRWPGNHVVKYWRSDWKHVIYLDQFSYLARIQLAGFDGVYLDRVDAYQQFGSSFPKARQEMVSFVRDLAATARARDPNFAIVAQNAEELLADRGYRSVLDAVAKEDLLYGIDGEGRRNSAGDIRASIALLARFKADGKPVLAVEYLTDPRVIDVAGREHRRLGFVPAFAARQLDGGLAPAAGQPTAAPCRPGSP